MDILKTPTSLTMTEETPQALEDPSPERSLSGGSSRLCRKGGSTSYTGGHVLPLLKATSLRQVAKTLPVTRTAALPGTPVCKPNSTGPP